jgi:hypothetical protein
MLMPDKIPEALNDILGIRKADLKGAERFKIGDQDKKSRACKVGGKGNDPLIRISGGACVMHKQQGDQLAFPPGDIQVGREVLAP